MTSKSSMLSSIEETLKKVTSSVLPSIENHVTSSEFDSRKDGLDFLEVKNSLLLSYLIDITKLIQYNNQNDNEKLSPSQRKERKQCIERLNEMKVIIEKIRPMEKKMRYQIDKLLTISSSSSSFALGGEQKDNEEEQDGFDGEDENDDTAGPVTKKAAAGDDIEMEESDPLAFRPNLDDFGNDSEAADDDDDDDDDDSDNESIQDDENDDDDDLNVFQDEDEDESDDDEEDDEEILAAKAALNAGRSSSSSKKSKKISRNQNNLDSDDDNEEEANYNKMKSSSNNNNSDSKNDNVYRAPKLAAVPYAEREKQQMKEERKLKKQRDRMKKSELLSTLKATYGDMPEEDDFGGGANIGKQREAARRLAEREAEKTRFEEDAFVRLTTSKKDKKLRKKIMRDEVSNLHSIADIGNLTAGVSIAFGGSGEAGGGDANDIHGGNNDYDIDMDGIGGEEIIKVTGSNRQSSRHANGKRRRTNEFEGKSSKSKRRNEPKNTYQRALFGMDGGSGKKKKK